jgi:hypothetical protein
MELTLQQPTAQTGKQFVFPKTLGNANHVLFVASYIFVGFLSHEDSSV